MNQVLFKNGFKFRCYFCNWVLSHVGLSHRDFGSSTCVVSGPPRSPWTRPPALAPRSPWTCPPALAPRSPWTRPPALAPRAPLALAPCSYHARASFLNGCNKSSKGSLTPSSLTCSKAGHPLCGRSPPTECTSVWRGATTPRPLRARRGARRRARRGARRRARRGARRGATAACGARRSTRGAAVWGRV